MAQGVRLYSMHCKTFYRGQKGCLTSCPHLDRGRKRSYGKHRSDPYAYRRTVYDRGQDAVKRSPFLPSVKRSRPDYPGRVNGQRRDQHIKYT